MDALILDTIFKSLAVVTLVITNSIGVHSAATCGVVDGFSAGVKYNIYGAESAGLLGIMRCARSDKFVPPPAAGGAAHLHLYVLHEDC